MLTPEADTHNRLKALLLLGLVVGTVNGLSRVAMPLYAAALGAQPWQVGIVGGLGYTGMLLMALPMGAWIDRHGSRVLFVRGVVVTAVMYLLLPLLQLPWQVIGGAALLGMVLPLRTIPVHTEFLSLLPQLSAAKAGWNRAANTLGMFFLGPAASAAVIASLGFAPVFQLAAAGLLLALLVARRGLAPAGGVAGQAADAPLCARIGAQLTLLAQHADLRRTMAIDFLCQMAVAYFVVFALVLAVRRFGLTLQGAAGLVTLQGLLFVFTLFAGGALVMRWREDLRYLLAFALLLGQALLYGLGTAPAALWLGAGLMGVGVGLQALTSTARFAEAMSRHGRGRVGGLTSLAPPAGGVLGAIGGGVVSQRLGIEAGFLVLALAYGVMLLVQARRVWTRSGPASG